MHIGGIFCDLAKPFVCVNHKMLLVKLHCYGIQGTVANWSRSHLTKKKKKKKKKKIFKKKKKKNPPPPPPLCKSVYHSSGPYGLVCSGGAAMKCGGGNGVRERAPP